MEMDGACKGQLTILPTEAGKTIAVLAKVGRIGISSRGFGKTTERGKMVNGKMVKYLEVNPDYVMVTPGDFVVSPSVQGAYASINEELNRLGRQLDEANDFSGIGLSFDSGKTPDDQLKVIYRAYVSAGKFTGTFSQFMTWAKGEQEKKNKEGAMKKDKIMKTKEPRQRVQPKDVAFEARIAGVSAKSLAEKINASADFEKDIESEKSLEPEQTLKLLHEAQKAGFDISDKKVRAKIIESAKKSKNAKLEIPILTEEEKKRASKITSRYLEEKISGAYKKTILGG